MRLVLQTRRGPAGVAAERREVDGGSFRIGRGGESDWVLPDPERVLSKCHCQLVADPGGWTVADTSSNGTMLNGAPLEPGARARLGDGDRLVLGSYEIEVHAMPATDEAGLRHGAPDRFSTGDPFPFPGSDEFGFLLPDADPRSAFEPVGAYAAGFGLSEVGADRASDLHEHIRLPRPPGDLLPADWDAPEAELPGAAAPRRDASRPDVSRPDIGPHDAPWPDATPPDASRLDTSRLDTSRREATPPDADRPPVARARSLAPGSLAPDVPDALRPAPDRPMAPRPVTPDAESSRPAAPRPGSVRPESVRPEPPGPGLFLPQSGGLERGEPGPVEPGPVEPRPLGSGPVGTGRVSSGQVGPGPVEPGSFIPEEFDQEVHVPEASAAPVTSPPPLVSSTTSQKIIPARGAPSSASQAARPGLAWPSSARGADVHGADVHGDADADGSGFAAFARGAGMAGAAVADPLAALHALGDAFAAMVHELRRTMMARAAIKSEFRIEQTMIRPTGNNPLKFAVDDADALSALLGTGRRSGMTPGEAVAGALRDMRLHELAVMTAMGHAVRDMLADFAPDRLEEEVPPAPFDAVAGRREARMWRAYRARHARASRTLQDDFDSAFGRSFVRAYEVVLREAEETDAAGEGTPP